MKQATSIDPVTSVRTANHISPGSFLPVASSLDKFGIGFLRLALVIVLLWIGGLKFAPYEADSIVPLISNSPVLRFLYRWPPPDYRKYINREGESIPAHRQWQAENRTYRVSKALGVTIVLIGFFIALHPVSPRIAAFGSLLLIFMAFTTLSFLFTTPEAWVPPLGDVTHGFPYLSGTGRLIVKDLIMLGAAFVTLADSARAALLQR